MKIILMMLLNVKNCRVSILTVGLIAMVFSNSVIVRSQNSNNTTNLRGQTQEVLVVPGSTTNAGEINFVSDRDNDGMSDGDEALNGTDPDDPSDADGDLDGDGVSNGDEVAKGTNPNVVDSDGDGVSDAEEIRLGYNPLDPNNTPPPNTMIVSLQITPNQLVLSVNTVFGTTPVQLTVTGITNIGTTVNLTNDVNTVYQSLDQSVAAVGTSGSVFGISAGSTTISVQNGTLTANTAVNVATFAPSALSALQIPGYANNVDVAGNYAYVAAGSAGLQIVDVTDHSNPQIVASLNTSGNAIDVRVVDNFAYVADGNAGLKIINVANPLAPVLIGAVDTPGEAQDVAVSNMRAFIADGNFGLQVIDVNNPATPVVIGSVDTSFIARGVDVSGNYVAVADDNQAGSSAIRIVNISNAALPQIVGNVIIEASALDVVVRGNLAYVAAYVGGLQIIDFSSPVSPVIIGGLPYGNPGGFVPQDVEIQDDFAFAADVVFFNAVPIVNIADPSNPTYQGVIDFSQFSDDDGTGIALDSQYVYMTGGNKLFIGRHRILEADVNGVAPTVNLTSPTAGQIVGEGKVLDLTATAADDVYVVGVQFKVNGGIVATDSASPYEFSYQVPLNTTAFSVTATAFDLAGNTATTSSVSVNVTPATPPTINVTAPVEGTVLIEGQTILLRAEAMDDEAVTRVRFVANGTEVASLFAPPYETQLTVPTGINSLAIEATATDTVGRTTTAVRALSVIPDPNTTATGRVLTINGQPVANANVTVFDNLTAQTASDGRFTILNVPSVRGDISVKATATIGGISATNLSIPFAPVTEATTNVGDIILATGATAPTTVGIGYFGNRNESIFYGQDLFVAYSDRLSSVYSFDGTDFVPRPVPQLETGSVTSGISSSLSSANSFFDNLTFVQLAGQSGIFNKFNANNRNAISRTQLSTGLSGESKYIGFGRDNATAEDVLAFLSDDGATGSVLKLKVGNAETFTVPLPANTGLHSLVLNDLDENGYTDILAVKPLTSGSAKLLSIRRNSSGGFEPLVESDIVERSANPVNGLNNVLVGNFANTGGKEVAVLGDDRVRIYNVNTVGGFVFQQEIVLPVGEVPTGIYAYALTNSGFSDLLITTKNTTVPESHSLLVYFNGETGGGCADCTIVSSKNDKDRKTNPSQNLFNTPTTRTYTISNSNGDARIVVGNWGGAFNRLDVVVIEGTEVKIFLDLTPVISGS